MAAMMNSGDFEDEDPDKTADLAVAAVDDSF